jgi:hypothetical protein
MNPEAIGQYYSRATIKEWSRKGVALPDAIKPEDMSKYPILLVAHAQIHSKKNRPSMTTYMDHSRMLVWDEQYSSKHHQQLSTWAVWEAIGGFQKATVGRDTASFGRWLKRIETHIDPMRVPQLAKRMMEDGPIAWQIPYDDSLLDAKTVIEQLVKNSLNQEILEMLLEFAGHDIAYYQIPSADPHNKDWIMYCADAIPVDLTKVVILDATASLSPQLKFDKTITVLPSKLSKRYDNMTLMYTNYKSTRTQLNSDTSESPEKPNKFLMEVEHLVSEHADERVLIFTMKEMVDKVAERFTHHDNVTVLHYGAHRASNDFIDAGVVIFYGISRHPYQVVVSGIMAHFGDLSKQVLRNEIDTWWLNEAAVKVIQAMLRSRGRLTIDGKCGNATIYLFDDRKALVELIKQKLPSIQVSTRIPIHLTKQRQNRPIKYIEYGNILAEILRTNGDRITIHWAKQQLETVLNLSKPLAKDMWRKVRDYACEASGYTVIDRTLVLNK